MDWITQFFGRFHPLLVHFPIGILILAFLLECLSRLQRYRDVSAAIQPSLLVGSLFALVSAASGYFLSWEGGYDDDLLKQHKYLGIATAVVSVVVFFVRAKVLERNRAKGEGNGFNILLLIPLIILVAITGHLGGSLTHGESYLTGIISGPEEVIEPSIKLQGISDIDNAVYYTDIIQPILEARCYSCHSSRKQKGELRLDGVSFIERGGEDGPILIAGLPDSSSIYKRLLLPLEDEKHMPPNEKPQLSSSEINLIQSWIMEGADFEKKLSQCKDQVKIKVYFQSLVEQSYKEKLIPEEEVREADANLLAALNKRGVIILPVSKESNYLSVSFLNKRSLSDEDLQSLLPLKQQIVWCDLGRTSVSDAGLNIVAQLTSLRQLNLEFTTITDKGMLALLPLSNLRYINLVGTRITDAGMNHITSLKTLQDVFVYQTAVTASGIRNFAERAPRIKVDTGGYQLPKLVTDSVVTKFMPL